MRQSLGQGRVRVRGKEEGGKGGGTQPRGALQPPPPPHRELSNRMLATCDGFLLLLHNLSSERFQSLMVLFDLLLFQFLGSQVLSIVS